MTTRPQLTTYARRTVSPTGNIGVERPLKYRLRAVAQRYDLKKTESLGTVIHDLRLSLGA